MRWWGVEVWFTIRELCKTIVADSLIFLVLLGLLGAGKLYLDRIPFDSSLHVIVEWAHGIAYVTVLVGLLASFTWFGLLFILGQSRKHYQQFVTLSGVNVPIEQLESRVEREIERVIRLLEQRFPKHTGGRVVPPTDERLAYDCHVIHFLDEIGVRVRNAAAWDAVGNYYFDKDAVLSQKAYDTAIEIDPENPVAYVNRGWLYRARLGDRARAYREFLKAIELGQRQESPVPWAHVAVAQYHEMAGRMDERRACLEKARGMFEELVMANPGDEWGYYGLGVCYKRLGDVGKAVDANTKAIELRRDFASGYYNQACYMALSENKEQCVENLKKMVAWVRPFIEVYPLKNDEDLRSVRDYAPFKAFLEVFQLA